MPCFSLCLSQKRIMSSSIFFFFGFLKYTVSQKTKKTKKKKRKKERRWSFYSFSILKTVSGNALFMKEFVIVYKSVCVPLGEYFPLNANF